MNSVSNDLLKKFTFNFNTSADKCIHACCLCCFDAEILKRKLSFNTITQELKDNKS